ncbi:MAG: hypothetical protein H6659_15850 [Ardenticatenaceae bacterium]|nr:hypothetical protein [Ardenticatenaceae bacterium]
MNNSTLVNNLANQGGAVFNFGNLSLTNNTLSGNVASGVGDEEGGGAIMQAYGVLTLTHNTIANNTAPTGQGEMAFGKQTAAPQFSTVLSPKTVWGTAV